MNRRRLVIMGAAGRDFHNFNMVYRDDPDSEVVAFTATQIPFIEERLYPPQLAGPLYPEGIPIHAEGRLPELISRHGVQQVVFAYSDIHHEQVMHKASLCLSCGADFVLLGPESTMIPSARPVISICAVRTGCGKSGITRYVVRMLKAKGLRPAVLRHPMPYCDLLKARVQRFESMKDLDRESCTIEEREEFEPLLEAGVVVFAGVDYRMILAAAEAESDVIVWDGGNNDLPFVTPDLEIVAFDPYRAGQELSYHPGETNLRRAHVAVINKVDTADEKAALRVAHNIQSVNPRAAVARTASRITADHAEGIRGKRVLVVEDGPTLTHGGMSHGAGLIAALQYGAAEVVDPRPHAVGSIRDVFAAYPHVGTLLPAMGYTALQLEELRETIAAVPCDLVLIATPMDLGRLIHIPGPSQRIRYEVEEVGERILTERIEAFAEGVRRGAFASARPDGAVCQRLADRLQPGSPHLSSSTPGAGLTRYGGFLPKIQG